MAGLLVKGNMVLILGRLRMSKTNWEIIQFIHLYHKRVLLVGIGKQPLSIVKKRYHKYWFIIEYLEYFVHGVI